MGKGGLEGGRGGGVCVCVCCVVLCCVWCVYVWYTEGSSTSSVEHHSETHVIIKPL